MSAIWDYINSDGPTVYNVALLVAFALLLGNEAMKREGWASLGFLLLTIGAAIDLLRVPLGVEAVGNVASIAGMIVVVLALVRTRPPA